MRLRLLAALTITVALFFGLTGRAFAVIPADAFEPDGTRALAKLVPVGDTIKDMRLQNHTISIAGERDWVHFIAQQGVTYYFHAPSRGVWYPLQDAPDRLKVNGNIYDSAGRLLKGLPGIDRQRIAWRAGATGTYYVRIDADGVPGARPSVGWYALQVATAPPSARVEDPAEPDDSTATAKPMTTFASTIPYFFANSLAKGQWHTIYKTGSNVDSDLYYIDVTQRQVDIKQPIGVGVATDGVFKRYCKIDALDATGKVVDTNPLGTVLTSPTLLPNWTLFVLTAHFTGGPGRYYIRIAAYTNDLPVGVPYYYRTYAYPSLGPREF